MAQTIKFDDDTDYEAVEIIVKQMYSDLKASKCKGCGCHGDLECKLSSIMVAMDINKDTNETRWQDNIKTAYKMLKSKCGC